MSCKREITFIMLMTQDNVIICDPEDEYSPLVKRLGGQVIRLSPSSTDYVNPLDINLNYSEEENPLALKSDFVLSFCELIMGSKTGLEAIEKTVIDRAVQMIYQPYFADPRPGNMPILGDLMNALLSQHIPEADRVAQALDLYVNGSLNFFNHRTTVDISNRLVCFDIKGLGKNREKPGCSLSRTRVEHRHHQPCHWPVYLVFRGRVPPFAEGGTDRRVQCRDLEALPQMGRRAHRCHPKCEGPSFFPGD